MLSISRDSAADALVAALRLAIGLLAACFWILLDPVAQRLGLFEGGPCATPGALVWYLLVPVWFVVGVSRSGGTARRILRVRPEG